MFLLLLLISFDPLISVLPSPLDPLDTLESWVSKYFTTVPNKHTDRPKFPSPFRPEDTKVLLSPLRHSLVWSSLSFLF